MRPITLVFVFLSVIHAQTLSLQPSLWRLVGSVNLLSTPPPTFDFPSRVYTKHGSNDPFVSVDRL